MKNFLHKIFRANKYLIFTNFSERSFFFIVFLIIARNYPPVQFGELVTVFSLANIFMIFFDFGLPVLLQREAAMNKESVSTYFNNVLTFNFLMFPFYLVSNLIYCEIFFRDISNNLVLAVCLLVYLFSISNILNKALSGLNLFKSQFISIIISRSFALVSILLSIFIAGIDLIYLVLLLISGAVIQLIILFGYSGKSNLKMKLIFISFAEIFKVINISFPLALAVIFNFLYDKIDIVLISMLTNYSEAAFYNVGYGIYRSSTIIFSFIFVSGFTRISFLSSNTKAVSLFFKKYSKLLFRICFVLTVVLYFFSEPVIKLIYTERYINSSGVLKILSFAIFGLALNNLTGIMLNGLGLYKKNMIVTFIGLIINVILNILFITKYGIIAAAVITVITEYFIFAGDYFFIRKFLK